ncbi:unnamed protein product [Candidula unifasciata]|uniref:G-protein coupled receptors family 1 profile domain-containing protein n=1 Tax=Candidula unifasciata TaxID=100452 RepID=A0A8S3YIX4_9EUPU|nr:unnamed protein product [Candidula unifasciata]
MIDQEHYIDYTTSSLFSLSNTTDETCSTVGTKSATVAEEETRSVVERALWSILLIIIILASIVGNMLVLACVYLHHRLREENSSIFIVNLSVADMISAAVVMISSLHALVSDQWLMGPAWCDIVYRYIAVRHALHYHARVTKLRIYVLLGYAWCLGLCFGLVPILYHWIRFDYWEAVCAIEWHEDRQHVLLFVTVGFSLCFVLPSVILIIAYSKVMKIALAHNKVHQQNAEIQASAATRKELAAIFVLQTATEGHRRNKHSSDNSSLQNENIAELTEELNIVSFSPTLASGNEEARPNVLYQPTDTYISTENESPNVQWNGQLKHPDGASPCETDTYHHLVTCSWQSDVATSMQPARSKCESIQPLHHCNSLDILVEQRSVIQATQFKSDLFNKLYVNENIDNSEKEILTNGKDLCSQRTASITLPDKISTDNDGDEEILSLRTDNACSSHSQQTSSNEVCKNIIATALSTTPFKDQTLHTNKGTLDRHNGSNTQLIKQTVERQIQATIEQTKQTAEIQKQLPSEKPHAENSTSVSLCRGPDRRRLNSTEDNNHNLTRRLSRSAKNITSISAKKNQVASNKAVKSLLLVMIAYFICMTPFCVTKLCKVVFINDVLPDYINLVASIFQYCSSAINPLIYGIFRKDFQRAFALLAKRFLGKFGATNAKASDAQSTVY